MTKIEKEKIADQIMNLLIQLTNDDVTVAEPAEKPVEMLTVKECCKEVKGLSENTVRKLVAQNKVKSFRTGEGRRGKILVNKADLISYFQK
ncbi:MAG: helix-turn-helix domain-containing protein [Ruminococcus flavefaciens]|nr:helix-turn-helix domain-containing protein [Ruminococcus flavefaciens]